MKRGSLAFVGQTCPPVLVVSVGEGRPLRAGFTHLAMLPQAAHLQASVSTSDNDLYSCRVRVLSIRVTHILEQEDRARRVAS